MRATTAFLALALCAAIVVVAAVASALWAVLAFVPLVNLVAIPSLIGSVLLLVHALPFAAYLLLAQTDAPKHGGSLFLPFSPARHLGILVAVVHYTLFVLSTAPALLLALARTAIRLKNTPASEKPASRWLPSAWWERFASFGITYQAPRKGRASKLDVFVPAVADKLPGEANFPPFSPASSAAHTLPDVDEGTTAAADDFPPDVWHEQMPGSPVDSGALPVIVFVYDVGIIGPIRPQRWMFSLVGAKLAEQGYVAVVPDLTLYPDGQVEDMVVDLRAVLAWVRKDISAFGGDPNNIYVCGHGLGAHLALYTLSQDAVVRSRDKLEIHNATREWPHLGHGPTYSRDIPNGLRQLRTYGGDIDIPEIRGVIMLSPVADVIKQVRHESKLWLEHVSPLRRALGSSQTRCMKHSLGHILFAARNLVEVEWLPERVLIIHGVDDHLVPIWQAVWLADLLNGLDVPTRLKQYTHLSHFDVVTSLMSGLEGKNTANIVHDIRWFVEGGP